MTMINIYYKRNNYKTKTGNVKHLQQWHRVKTFELFSFNSISFNSVVVVTCQMALSNKTTHRKGLQTLKYVNGLRVCATLWLLKQYAENRKFSFEINGVFS